MLVFENNRGFGLLLGFAMLFAAFLISCYGQGRVFESDTLDMMYDSTMRMLGASALKYEIHFHPPQTNEKLPLNSFILTDRNSELILRFELVRGKELTGPFIIHQLEFMMIPGPVDERGGKYYKTIPGGSWYILRNISRNKFFDNFSIYVESYSGTVRLSSDVDTISKIDPGEFVWGGLGEEF